MTADVLPRAFYARDTLVVARDLLGKLLVRRVERRTIVGRIVETEAYHGPDDAASHAHRGPTPRSAIMFGPPGFAYVYLIYGMYSCLNVVTMAEGTPAAVLLRAVAVEGNPDPKAGAGPGKLCRELAIDRTLNGLDLVRRQKLWITDDEDDGARPQLGEIAAGPRIGVDYAGEWAGRPWRFWLAGNPSVSRSRG